MPDAPEELSVPALRVELSRRGLLTTGLKSALQARLAEDLKTGAPHISVPRRFRGIDSTNPAAPKRPRPSDEDASGGKESQKRQKVKVTGHYVGRSVWVMGEEQMAAIWTISDAYGKGNLSRSAPTFTTATDPLATKGKAARQLIALEKFAQKSTGVETSRDNVEHLQLALIEAFHATFHAKRMQLVGRDGKLLNDPAQVWQLFSKSVDHFPALFAAYSRYRATGWMPRSGLKYGVDWVLYPLGSERHLHAPYCIIISHPRKGKASILESSWIRLQNKLRLVKNVAKSLIVTEVYFDDGFVPATGQEAIEKVRISEVTVDRWVP